MNENVVIRRARSTDAGCISALNNLFADKALMLRRSPEMISLAIDDYVVAVDAGGRLLACGALKEYSPSVAEVAAIAVATEAHGQGLGRRIVSEVERLALVGEVAGGCVEIHVSIWAPRGQTFNPS